MFRDIVICVILLTATSGGVAAATKVPLSASSSGSLELQVELGGEQATFLLDTGASMATINGALFDRIAAAGRVEKVRQVGAKMADGRVRQLSVYSVKGIRLNKDCDLGEVEVVLVPGKGRNLLGMNVLSRFSPLTLHMDPPALGLSQCSASNTMTGLVVDQGSEHHTSGRFAPYAEPSSTYSAF